MKLWATWEKDWVCCETALRSVPPQLERLIWTQGKYSEYLHNELKSTSICIRILIGWRRECVVEAGLVCHVGVCHDGKNKETDTGQRTSRCLVLTSSSQVWGHSSDSRLKLCVYVCVRVFVDLPLLLPGSDVTPSVATFGSSLNLWKQALGYIDVERHTHTVRPSHTSVIIFIQDDMCSNPGCHPLLLLCLHLQYRFTAEMCFCKVIDVYFKFQQESMLLYLFLDYLFYLKWQHVNGTREPTSGDCC